MSLICFSGAILCWVLAVMAFWIKRGRVPWLFFGLGMVLVAADDTLGGFILQAAAAEQVVFLQRVRLMVLALLPGTWLVFSLTYSRGNHIEFLKRWRSLLGAAYAIPLLAILGFGWGAAREMSVQSSG